MYLCDFCGGRGLRTHTLYVPPRDIALYLIISCNVQRVIFFLVQYVLPSLPPPPTEPMIVNTINYSPIHISIPTVVYDDYIERGWWRRCVWAYVI